MVFRIAGGIFLLLVGVQLLGLHAPSLITDAAALVAGVALLAGY